jgi:hypothetical protein
MLYDIDLPKQEKSPEEVIIALNKNPLTRKAAIEMIKDGIKVKFVRHPERRWGFGLPDDSGGWHIYVDRELSDTEKERVIWHELVHLHLRRIFKRLINDCSSRKIHLIVAQYARQVAGAELLTYRELFNLTR